ncbi:MAG TPA: 4-hydroxythreonine-4-phosphate dehydrogenase PdxA [Xanthobacteraceae bacterium]|nr:4-hydroxythreonine-4-phosphate dehydrogenase PdxA [Xanthobacteraceae bacterium]
MTDADKSISDPRPCLALLLGDCTGIGPELVAKVLHQRRMAQHARLVVVGDARVLELGMRDAKVDFPWRRVTNTAEVDWTSEVVPVIDLRNINPADFPQGVASSESGRLTGETLASAIKMAQRGEIDGITFAPLNKRAMYDGGWRFPDEHKMFAHLLGHNGHFSEMNVLDGQWMTRVTSHVSLREAVEQVTRERIRDALRLADASMRQAGIENPRIAVAALNPHNGENGLFGTEEIEIIRPAVEEMAARGINCKGPFPSDTVYIKAFAGEYDSVLSMYHDQGQIATKLKGFNRGVTITAGLPIIFTTPAHGTAFDIVGKGAADTGATEQAIMLAAKMAARRSITAETAEQATIAAE